MQFSAMIGGPDCGDLGYGLGYLRHGSFGRAAPDGPADRGARLPVRWRGRPYALARPAGVLWPGAGGRCPVAFGCGLGRPPVSPISRLVRCWCGLPLPPLGG